MATPRRDGLTSTAVTGIFYGYGIEASRDRIARLSNVLFGADLRRAGSGQRRFTSAQVEILVAAHEALEGADIDLTVVERSMGAHHGDPLTRFRAVLATIMARRQHAVASAAARFAAAMAPEGERMTA